MQRTEEQIKLVQDELAEVQVINFAVRDKVNAEEERCVQAEETLRVCTCTFFSVYSAC